MQPQMEAPTTVKQAHMPPDQPIPPIGDPSPAPVGDPPLPISPDPDPQPGTDPSPQIPPPPGIPRESKTARREAQH